MYKQIFTLEKIMKKLNKIIKIIILLLIITFAVFAGYKYYINSQYPLHEITKLLLSSFEFS